MILQELIRVPSRAQSPPLVKSCCVTSGHVTACIGGPHDSHGQSTLESSSTSPGSGPDVHFDGPPVAPVTAELGLFGGGPVRPSAAELALFGSGVVGLWSPESALLGSEPVGAPSGESALFGSGPAGAPAAESALFGSTT